MTSLTPNEAKSDGFVAFRRMARRLVLLVSAVLSANALAESSSCPENVSYCGVALLPFRYAEWPAPDSGVAGLRLGILAGRHESVTGVDLSAFLNYADSELCGLGLSAVNSHGESYGLQVGLVNATGIGCGVQLGLWNMAEEYRGLQVGVGNFAQRMCGVQIGLGDIIVESPFPTCIIVNACF